jgi:hypothetical protein
MAVGGITLAPIELTVDVFESTLVEGCGCREVALRILNLSVKRST